MEVPGFVLGAVKHEPFGLWSLLKGQRQELFAKV
jgi:hypothetical protein